MNNMPNVCPFCGGDLTVTHLYCQNCDTNIEGRFVAGASTKYRQDQQAFIEKFVALLNTDQLAFVETFVRCEGRLNRMEDELGMSYPTLRNRLDEVIRALGYEPGSEESLTGLTPEKRQKVLEDLDQGRITAEEAMHILEEREG
jgi:hypothetical protein